MSVTEWKPGGADAARAVEPARARAPHAWLITLLGLAVVGGGAALATMHLRASEVRAVAPAPVLADQAAPIDHVADRYAALAAELREMTSEHARLLSQEASPAIAEEPQAQPMQDSATTGPVSESPVDPVAARIAITQQATLAQLDPDAAPVISGTPADEQQTMLERVASMIRIGDIAGARLILGRLDRLGNPRATFALAQTFDPIVLAQWKVLGIKAEAEKALELYRRAMEGGVGAARERLAALQR